MRPVASLPRTIFLVGMIAVLVAAFVLHATLANDNEKELKAQAEALLAKSHDLSNIEAPGSPAFTLNATIHYQIGTQTAEGEGQIIWTAPDHYRAAYSAPNYSYVEIVRDGYRYLTRTNNDMPLMMYEMERTVERTMHASASPKDKIKTVNSVQSGNEALVCLAFKNPTLLDRCIDSNGDVVTSERNAPPAMSALDERYEFGDFVGFTTKRFPRKIVFSGGDDHTIEIDVQQLALMKGLPGDAFNVPADAMKETWCAEPKMDNGTPMQVIYLTDPAIGLGATEPLRDAKASLYYVVGPAGRARAVTVIHSTKPLGDKDLRTWMASMQFPPLRCGKNGVEYQIEASFAH
ncbi:MAG: hypothetical protein WA020_15020 [Candidatus Acidiferrales bacterium]